MDKEPTREYLWRGASRLPLLVAHQATCSDRGAADEEEWDGLLWRRRGLKSYKEGVCSLGETGSPLPLLPILILGCCSVAVLTIYFHLEFGLKAKEKLYTVLNRTVKAPMLTMLANA